MGFQSYGASYMYMRSWTVSWLVWVMAYRLYGGKPLPKPMINYCQFHRLEQISVKIELNTKIFILEYAFKISVEGLVC